MELLNKVFTIKENLIDAHQFELRERVLQFGTGVLLRGLVDYVIDKANKTGKFNGRVVVVKTTNSDASDFDKQDGVFTHNEQGIENGEIYKHTTINTSITRVVSANENWETVLALAENLEIDIIISNTTEAGLKYVADDDFNAVPPHSFPLKLTRFLFERFNFVKGNGEGLIIIPTELLVGNGDLLKSFVVQHAERNNLPEKFINWLHKECRFCNSLVDRIVTGAPSMSEQKVLEKNYGYADNMIISSESFLLWAIEGDDFVREKLSFAEADERVLISENIENFREQKLRILNGGHTISVPLAYLSGLRTVGEMMNDATMKNFVEAVIKKEIAPTLNFDALDFADKVLDRFRNPFIIHKLISIMLQCSSKMNTRNSLTIVKYFEKFGALPQKMVLGFAAYLLFTKPIKQENNQFFGQTSGSEFYLIQDEYANFFDAAWKSTDISDLKSLNCFVQAVLDNASIFNPQLKSLPGFIENVAQMIFDLKTFGVQLTVEKDFD